MKVCVRCSKTKTLDQFYSDRQKKDGKTPYCKDCRKEKAAAWHAANPDKARERSKRAREKDSLDYDLRRMGTTREQYMQQLLVQDGKCAACKQPETLILEKTGEARRLSVDHNHKCCDKNRDICGNCNRGLLCNRCNRLLGVINDDIEVLEQLIEYLRSYQ